MTVTIGVLSSVAGILTSVIFEFWPKLHDGYNKLPDIQQKAIMAGATLVMGAAAMGLACSGILVKLFPGAILPCTQATGWDLAAAWIASFFSSQVTFLGLLQKKPVTPAG